jgi:diguanylate cyclase (GGDEF)-like protein
MRQTWKVGSVSETAFSEQSQLAAFRALHQVTKRVHSSLDLDSTLDAVAQGVVDGAGFGVAVVNLARPDGAFVVVSVAGDQNARKALLGSVGAGDVWAEELKKSEQLGQLRFVDGRTEPDFGNLPSWVSSEVAVSDDEDAWHPLNALFAPLTSPSDEWLGVLSVDLPVHGRRPDPWQLEILELFADHAAIAIEHARMHTALLDQEAQARHAATHDALTGLANRTLLMGSEDLAGRVGTELAVLLIDLDGFKNVNDTMGHEAGDEVLRAVAGRLRDNVRGADVIARVGGDEFVVVLTGRQISKSADALAGRLQIEVSRPIEGSFGVYMVGASIGVAVASTPMPLSDLLSRADAAMYVQKRERASGVAGAPPALGRRFRGEQAEQLVGHIGRRDRGQLGVVVGRSHLDDVRADQVQPGQTAQDHL